MMLLSHSLFADDQCAFHLARASERSNDVFVLKIWSDAFGQKLERFSLADFLTRSNQTRATEGLLALIGTLANRPSSGIDSLAIFRGRTNHAEMLLRQAGKSNVKSLLSRLASWALFNLHRRNHEILVSDAFAFGSEVAFMLARLSGTADKVFILEVWSPWLRPELRRYDLIDNLSSYDAAWETEGLLAAIGTLAVLPASSLGIDDKSAGELVGRERAVRRNEPRWRH